MKQNFPFKPLPLALVILLGLASPLQWVNAAETDLANLPLANAATVTILPNIYFILDDSGSMDWDYMPDYTTDSYCRGSGTSLISCDPGDPAFYSSAFNRVYYNPLITYTPPINADGSSKTNYNTTWTNVPLDGYGIQTSSKIDLLSNYVEKVACKNDGDNPSGSNCKTQIDTSNNYSYPDATYKKKVTKKGAPFYYNVTVEWCKNTATSGPKFGKAGTCQTKKDSTYKYVRYSNWERVNIVPTNNSYPGPSGSTRTYTEEMTNFANWHAWYRTRMQMTKTGVGHAFVDIKGTPDPDSPTDKNFFHARVGFSTINKTNTSDGTAFLKIDNFDTTHKNTWFTRLYATDANGSTPLRGALAKAGRIYAGKLAPDPIQYSCQRNFTILSSDGYWNTPNESDTYGPTKEDGSTTVGEQDGNTGVTSPSFDKNKTSHTLADVAYYYYHTDLRPGTCSVCTNNVPPAGTKDNEDDVAQHQHMTTFTVGLGVDGTLAYQDGYKTSTTGDYQGLKQGTTNWPVVDTWTDDERKIDDLWHSAVNGRGTYFSARDPETLVKGLVSALGSMESATGSGAAAATSSLEPVEGDSAIYIANYRTVSWDGELAAHNIDLSTGTISTTSTWKASTLLDAKIGATGATDTRTIYTSKDSALVDFKLDNLSSAQQLYFNNDQLSQHEDFSEDELAAATPTRLLEYIRGQNRYEDQDRNIAFGSYSRLYRDRSTALGDIIHSQPVYVKDPKFDYEDAGYASFKTAQAGRAPTVYLSANDGMLHAINADSTNGGDERWAYVPPMVMKNLWRLADKDYATNHRYFVDGPLAVGDIYDGAWKTILVGALGKGGRGYYALDITNPTAPEFLWTFSADDHPNMGYSYGAALITKVNGVWSVLLPSGYNNIPEDGNYAAADGKGTLFVLNAATGSLIKNISTSAGSVTSPSGLGQINSMADDFNADNSSKVAYGGDLDGNMWRFDLEGGSVTKVIALGTSQPITAAPEIGEINDKTILFFGTGRYLGQSDLTITDTQALYGIKDVDNETVTKSSLIQQTISGNTISANPVDWSSDGGWYINLPDSKERVHLNARLVMGTVVFASTIPEASECQPGGYSHMFFVDYNSGGSIDGKQAIYTVVSPIVGISIFKLPDGTIKVVTVTADGKIPAGEPTSLTVSTGGGGAAEKGKRMMWRELID